MTSRSPPASCGCPDRWPTPSPSSSASTAGLTPTARPAHIRPRSRPEEETVPSLPIATFLAGALLSLLIPTIMLTALSVWYMLFLRRVPDTVEEDKPGLPDPALLPDEATTGT